MNGPPNTLALLIAVQDAAFREHNYLSQIETLLGIPPNYSADKEPEAEYVTLSADALRWLYDERAVLLSRLAALESDHE